MLARRDIVEDLEDLDADAVVRSTFFATEHLLDMNKDKVSGWLVSLFFNKNSFASYVTVPA
jgi:hypothetical protein